MERFYEENKNNNKMNSRIIKNNKIKFPKKKVEELQLLKNCFTNIPVRVMGVNPR